MGEGDKYNDYDGYQQDLSPVELTAKRKLYIEGVVDYLKKVESRGILTGERFLAEEQKKESGALPGGIRKKNPAKDQKEDVIIREKGKYAYRWMLKGEKISGESVADYLGSLLFNFIRPGSAPKNRLCKVGDGIYLASRFMQGFESQKSYQADPNNPPIIGLGVIRVIEAFLGEVDGHGENVGVIKGQGVRVDLGQCFSALKNSFESTLNRNMEIFKDKDIFESDETIKQLEEIASLDMQDLGRLIDNGIMIVNNYGFQDWQNFAKSTLGYDLESNDSDLFKKALVTKIQERQQEVKEYLIKAKIFHAISKGDIEYIKAEIERDPKILDIKDYKGHDLFIQAVVRGKHEIAELLAENMPVYKEILVAQKTGDCSKLKSENSKIINFNSLEGVEAEKVKLLLSFKALRFYTTNVKIDHLKDLDKEEIEKIVNSDEAFKCCQARLNIEDVQKVLNLPEGERKFALTSPEALECYKSGALLFSQLNSIDDPEKIKALSSANALECYKAGFDFDSLRELKVPLIIELTSEKALKLDEKGFSFTDIKDAMEASLHAENNSEDKQKLLYNTLLKKTLGELSKNPTDKNLQAKAQYLIAEMTEKIPVTSKNVKLMSRISSSLHGDDQLVDMTVELIRNFDHYHHDKPKQVKELIRAPIIEGWLSGFKAMLWGSEQKEEDLGKILERSQKLRARLIAQESNFKSNSMVVQEVKKISKARGEIAK